MTYLLDTDRLYLRPCQIEDLKALYELWSDREIRRFLFDDRPITLEEAQAFIIRSVESFQNYGYGIWLFFENQQNAIAGFTGLLDYTQEAPSLIFGTKTQFWGRGYATEATLAVLNYVFEVLKLDRAIADVDEPNQGSIRVLEKLGMIQTKQAIVNERSLLFYEKRLSL